MDWGEGEGRRKFQGNGRWLTNVRCCGSIREKDVKKNLGLSVGRFIDFFCEKSFKGVGGNSQTPIG